MFLHLLHRGPSTAHAARGGRVGHSHAVAAHTCTSIPGCAQCARAWGAAAWHTCGMHTWRWKAPPAERGQVQGRQLRLATGACTLQRGGAPRAAPGAPEAYAVGGGLYCQGLRAGGRWAAAMGGRDLLQGVKGREGGLGARWIRSTVGGRRGRGVVGRWCALDVWGPEHHRDRRVHGGVGVGCSRACMVLRPTQAICEIVCEAVQRSAAGGSGVHHS